MSGRGPQRPSATPPATPVFATSTIATDPTAASDGAPQPPASSTSPGQPPRHAQLVLLVSEPDLGGPYLNN
jgi:hypothetical protein